MMGAESFQGAAETLGGGSYPVDVDFSKVNMGPVMSSFTEAFATNSALIDDYTAYIADSKIPLLQPTNTEIQALFVGRSVDDVAQAIDAIYMEIDNIPYLAQSDRMYIWCIRSLQKSYTWEALFCA